MRQARPFESSRNAALHEAWVTPNLSLCLAAGTFLVWDSQMNCRRLLVPADVAGPVNA